jgi:predicted nucleic acid-binding protein
VTVLVDTSIWIEHFRKGHPRLPEFLRDGMVLMHPFVLGELACGNLKTRGEILGDLAELPKAVEATHEETLDLMERRKLWGRGIGWVDAHLIASALLSNCRFLTIDEKLHRAAAHAGVRLEKGG